MSLRSRFRTIGLGLLLSGSLHAQQLPSVGMPARLEEVVLPGPELEVNAADARSPLVLRITRVSPHGAEFRYDFEYVGLEPGKYDLRDALRHKDGTPIARAEDAAGAANALQRLEVEVTSVLPAGVVKPHPPAPGASVRMGGYTKTLIVLGVLWLVGLVVILFGWRERRRQLAASVRPRTLAERLRPLVENALAGRLSREERAQLELGLVAYWRRKLALDDERPAHTLTLLREHPQAGPLLSSLEAWLHMPTPPADVDLQALLAPYRDLPADAIPEIDAARGAGPKPR